MEISTAICLIIVAGIIVGGWLFSKEIDLRKPPQPLPQPHPPMSDAARAIEILNQQLEQLNSFYDDNNDDDVLAEISKINTVLASIATKPAGTMCKCGGKNV